MEPESVEDKENDDPNDAEGQTSRLWVDRFSPQHYTELLSDDVSFQCNFTDISITACKLFDQSKIILHSSTVVYQPLSAQVVEALGHRRVWKREEVPPSSF